MKLKPWVKKGIWGLRTRRQYKSMPSVIQIAQYWAGRAEFLAKKAEELNLDWTEQIPKFLHQMHIDYGEAECMGCRSYRWSKYESTPKFWKTWKVSGLIRCHIVPKSRGGTFHPNNIVLLCNACHLEAPDTSKREYMIKWLNQRYNEVFQRGLKECIAALKAYSKWDLEDPRAFDLLNFYHEIHERGLKKDFEDFKYEFGSSHLTEHGAIYKWSTWIASMFAYAKDRLDWDV